MANRKWEVYSEVFCLSRKDDTEKQIPNDDEIRENETTPEELLKAIQKIKIGKAPGHDEVTGNDKYRKEMLEIMNQCVRETQTPKYWKLGIITPIYKSGDSKECGNYRGITLGSVVGKIFARVLDKKLREQLEDAFDDSQSGFRKGRGIQYQIFTIRQICEKRVSTNRDVHMRFIDMEKAFDRVKREDVWDILRKSGVNRLMIETVKSLYKNTESYGRVRNERSEKFTHLKQGCILGRLLFNLLLDELMKRGRRNMRPYVVRNWRMNPLKVTELCYADDMLVVAESEKDLHHNLETINKELKKYGI